MTVARTGAQHIASLRDGRTVYIDGQLVPDVTTHPAFKNSVRSAAALYDFQAQPENIELMTFMPEGSDRRVNRAWQMPRNYEEMVQRRKALQAWARLSYGFMGRSPDHVASTLIGQRMGIEVFRKHGPHRARALIDYVDYATRNDMFLTYVIINPQAERTKDWGAQADDLVARIVDEDITGMTIRGAKMLGTCSIMANEVLVANLQPLKAGEEDLAFSCALPMNARGVRVLSRKSYEASAVSVFDNPLSSRFDENDALIYFDDVKVPWDAFLFTVTPTSAVSSFTRPGPCLPELPGADPPFGENPVPCGAGAPADRGHRHHQDPLRERKARLHGRAGQHGGSDAVGHGGERLQSRRVLGAEQALHVFGAGAHAGPLSAVRQCDPRTVGRRLDHAAILDQGLQGSVAQQDHPDDPEGRSLEPEDKVKFLKACWDAVGSEFGSRHQQYEMFYAGARFVTAGHSFRTYDWNGATGMVENLLASYSLGDELTGHGREM